MEKKLATQLFVSLSSGVRLDVFRLLVKCGTTGLVAGQIATELDLPSTNLSFHLKALTQAGLLSVEQEGRFLRYRANIPLMLELISYLTEECCFGDPQQCQEFRSCSPDVEPFLPKLNLSSKKTANSKV